VIEQGSGPALVLIPGLPGPWEFIRPAVSALSSSFRVLTMSLGPECTIDSDVARVVAALDERRIDRAVVCGISFGGLVALRFAAAHPRLTSALVLASVPGPGAHLRPHHRLYAQWPHLFGPVLMIETPVRLRQEILRAIPDRRRRWAFDLSTAKALFETGISFSKIARRAQLIEQIDITADCARVTAQTLVVTGEAGLDHVVPTGSTSEYLRAIPGSTHVVLESTGHLGSITRPEMFHQVMTEFAGQGFQPRLGGSGSAALRVVGSEVA
jgi:pimeloyl-ACP methyl ester carboxylesterase